MAIPAILGLLGAGLASSAASAGLNYASQGWSQSFNSEEAQKQRDWSAEQAAITRDFNSVEAQKARDWSAKMYSTQYQTAVKDLQAAGLNPVLAAGSSPTSFSPGGASASTPTGSAAQSAGAARVADISSGLMAGLSSAKLLSDSSFQKSLEKGITKLLR